MVASEEPIATPSRLKPVLVILWLLLISAPILESDSYRYAALLLIGATFETSERPIGESISSPSVTTI